MSNVKKTSLSMKNHHDFKKLLKKLFLKEKRAARTGRPGA